MHKMSKNGIKVMRQVAWIYALIGLLIVLGLLITSFFVDGFAQSVLRISTLVAAVLLIIFIIISVWIKPKYEYLNFGYAYNEEFITIRKGFLWIKQAKMPIFRIQNIDMDEGFFMRKYDLVTITLSSAGGNRTLKLLDKMEASKVMQKIKTSAVPSDQFNRKLDDEIAELSNDNEREEEDV
ncbi:PH domain-containing protein [Staphylococcus sp. 11261D007BR]